MAKMAKTAIFSQNANFVPIFTTGTLLKKPFPPLNLILDGLKSSKHASKKIPQKKVYPPIIVQCVCILHPSERDIFSHVGG